MDGHYTMEIKKKKKKKMKIFNSIVQIRKLTSRKRSTSSGASSGFAKTQLESFPFLPLDPSSAYYYDRRYLSYRVR